MNFEGKEHRLSFTISLETWLDFWSKWVPTMEYTDYWYSPTMGSQGETTVETVLSSIGSSHSSNTLDELPRSRAGSQDFVQTSIERRGPSRQLPCRTYLSCGSCSFDEKCQFLHCGSLRRRPHPSDLYLQPIRISTVPKRCGKEVSDAFYFPTLPKKKKDYAARINSEYKPSPNLFFRSGTPHCLSNRAAALSTWSLWNWLIDLLDDVDGTHSNQDGARSKDAETNFHTGKSRLPVFQQLGKGESISTLTINHRVG
jgi:hypothetical protein